MIRRPAASLAEPHRTQEDGAEGPDVHGTCHPHASARRTKIMLRLLLHWLLSALALILTSRVVPGFEVRNLTAALVAALVIGLLNATLGLVLKIITFPISILTFGLFLLVINGVMILVASSIVRGFRVYGMVPAFWGALVLALLGMLFRAIAREA
jgi:putative membrane protein